MSAAALAHVLRQVIRRNHVRHGLVYLQVTRGAGPREFYFPDAEVTPTVVCLARSVSPARLEANAAVGIAVKSMPDIRWQRCDIKTVMLLPACLAKEAARQDGAREAWFVDKDGFVTEGASSNAWIVDASGAVITRKLGVDILPGVTRATLLEEIEEEGMQLIERPFTLAEAHAAREAFITSATQTVMPVVRIDGRSVGEWQTRSRGGSSSLEISPLCRDFKRLNLLLFDNGLGIHFRVQCGIMLLYYSHWVRTPNVA